MEAIKNMISKFKIHEQILLTIVCLIVGSYLFWAGFHNTDFATNMINIENEVNALLEEEGTNLTLTLYAHSLEGNNVDVMIDRHDQGLRQMLYGFYINSFGILVMIYDLMKKKLTK